MKSKVKPTRTLLTWDEIHAIQKSWESDKDGPGYTDVRKLVRHIKFIEHMNGILVDQLQEMKQARRGVRKDG